MTDVPQCRKVTMIFEDESGVQTTLESDDFDYIELTNELTNPPKAWSFEWPRETLSDNAREITVLIHRARTYTIYLGNKPDPTPVLDDPNVVEMDGDGDHGR